MLHPLTPVACYTPLPGQARAKAELREEVTEQDAYDAVEIVKEPVAYSPNPSPPLTLTLAALCPWPWPWPWLWPWP